MKTQPTTCRHCGCPIKPDFRVRFQFNSCMSGTFYIIRKNGSVYAVSKNGTRHCLSNFVDDATQFDFALQDARDGKHAAQIVRSFVGMTLALNVEVL